MFNINLGKLKISIEYISDIQIKNFLCKIGFHKWDVREIHITEQIVDEYKLFPINTAILERCSCGQTKLVTSGRSKKQN